MPKIGIIGGSGLYGIPGLRAVEATGDRTLKTPFGEPSAPYRIGELSGSEVAFLPRHGVPHSIPPHKVNYRANIWGLKSLGVERIIAVSATGGVNPDLAPGEIVSLDQVIDMTQGMREATFYEDGEVVHIDFTDPYCPEIRAALQSASQRAGIGRLKPATYICANGPRLESRAEIKFFSLIGADVVGMTGMPEAGLARELEICYAGVCVVTNHAAGISPKKLSAQEVIEKMKEAEEKIKALLTEAVPLLPAHRACPCGDSLKDAKV